MNLSSRELQVTMMLSSGAGVSEVGRALGLSRKTISTYAYRAKQKLGLETTQQLREHMVAGQQKEKSNENAQDQAEAS